jgi:hypothetical protein
MRLLIWLSLTIFSGTVLFISLNSCNRSQASVFDIVRANTTYLQNHTYVFVPPLYCHGCLERSLSILRTNEVGDYTFISTEGYHSWKKPNEHLIIVTDEIYKSSVEYDYKIYAIVFSENSNPVKLCLDIEQSFPVLDSLMHLAPLNHPI